MSKILSQKIYHRFTAIHQEQPLLIFSPGRINLIGEHTDYNDGFVLPAAINKGICTAIQKSTNKLCNVEAFDINETHQFDLNDIVPLKNGGWRNYIIGVVAEIQKLGLNIANFNMVFGGNIPNGAGLSSSAAVENGVVYGLNEIFELGLSKDEMILISQRAEHHFANVKCGIMDQFASMFGVENHAVLLDCKTMESKKTAINFGDYQLLLINTNVKHSLTNSAYNDRREKCEEVARFFNKESLRAVSLEELKSAKNNIPEDAFAKALYVLQENKRVLKTVEALEVNDLEKFGELLYQSHNGLQHQFEVSCEELDFLVDLTKKSHAILGARMMGGGFGGCTINLIKKSAVEPFSNKVKKAYANQFNRDCSIYDIFLSNGTHKLN